MLSFSRASSGRPLFAHANRQTSSLGPSLRLALQWWKEVLDLNIAQVRPWRDDKRDRAVVLADARGWPARVAAVVLVDGQIHWTTMAISDEILQYFKPRGDNQIGSLEILAIALAVSTFPGAPRRRASALASAGTASSVIADLLRDRQVDLYSDNSGAEAAAKKGTAKEFDHASLVHGIWKRAAELNISLWVERVPTDDNWSDLPSRQE